MTNIYKNFDSQLPGLPVAFNGFQADFLQLTHLSISVHMILQWGGSSVHLFYPPSLLLLHYDPFPSTPYESGKLFGQMQLYVTSELQSHVTQKLGQISKILPEQI